MNNLARKSVQLIKPYNPPIEGRRIYRGYLLDFNERTEPYGAVVKTALLNFAEENKFQYYPEYGNTTPLVADYAQVKAENILITNGSDRGIDLIFRVFTGVNDEVIIPSPSFAMFYQCAQIGGNKIITPVYDSSNGAFPTAEVLGLINSRTKLVVICNPNNPTGGLASLGDIEKILRKAKKSMVYVDEAYVEYSGVSAVSLINQYPNLVITRTFSKAFGLAALRVGYIIASSQVIDELNKVRGPYDINMAGAVAAQAVLNDLAPLNSYLKEVMTMSKPMVERFFKDYGIFFYPSAANFILFKFNGADAVFESLTQQGFRLRPRKGFGFDDTLRLTLGMKNQTVEFVEMFKKICQKN